MEFSFFKYINTTPAKNEKYVSLIQPSHGSYGNGGTPSAKPK
jgi:hypothetical protein